MSREPMDAGLPAGLPGLAPGLAGVMLADSPTDAGANRAEAADRHGFGRFHLADRGLDGRDQWVMLGATARTTRHIRLGLVTNPFTRTPATTANALRTLRELTGGRAFVVLARGGERILSGGGAVAHRPIAAVQESLRVIGELCPGAETWVATKGPAMAAMALRHADGLLLSGVPHALLPEVTAKLRAAMDRPVTLGLSVAYGGDGTASTRDGLIRVALELGNLREEYREAAGIDAALVEAVKRELFGGGSLDRAAALVPPDLLPQFTLVAPRPELRTALDRLREHSGADVVEISASALFDDGGRLLAPQFTPTT
ncbi:LLM class flavin-dependent oxidoreductase [Nonomuraea sp. NPDC050310]|uniref:LLM class flavin-dependent oxidoreductase n=1 Tax=Nonomuraea sp. NPDC050310 TaxID=3154935 RepID=UPI0033CA30F0